MVEASEATVEDSSEDIIGNLILGLNERGKAGIKRKEQQLGVCSCFGNVWYSG